MLESRLRDYYAGNLSKIDGSLRLIETEHAFPGGRTDIFALKGRKKVAIELKSKPYETQRVCVQLMNYLNYADLVYFVAPKVRYGVYSTLKNYKRLSLYEISSDLSVSRVGPNDLDDSREFPKLRFQNKNPLLTLFGDVMSAKIENPRRNLLSCVLRGISRYSN